MFREKENLYLREGNPIITFDKSNNNILDL